MNKNGEASRGPLNLPTPARGGRSGDRSGDRSGGERRERNVTALEELMRRRGVDEAWTALEEMQQRGVATDKYTVSRMLMKTVGDNRSRMNPARVYRGIGLVEKFIEMQPKDVDEVLLNALLDTCCRLKDLSRLESIMQRMRDLKITASPVTLGILVKTYGQAGDTQKVLQVWDEMEVQRGQANAVTYGCMIDACVKCGHLPKAVEIFQGMRESGKHRNTILYTTLIKGFGLEKDLNSALELFREMPREGVPYNTITYNSIIDACVKGGDLATAESLLNEIASPSTNLEPDLITFSTLLKGYCHRGDLDKALQLVEAIKVRGLRCDELVYNTLMDGCVKANDVTAGVGLFEEMVQNGMRPSAITHSILARLYQRAGYEEDASEAVAQLYQHHGIERPIGGDRSRTNGRRNQNQNQRGHFGQGAGSPTASPMSGYGMSHNNFMTGYESYTDQSGASTPCGSPYHAWGQGNGSLLPMDAMYAQAPPFPGMSGSTTPHASSMSGASTPVNSAFGSYGGSPCMSPTHMEMQQSQGVMMTIPASPNQVHMMAAQPNGGMPVMPPWPTAGNTLPAGATIAPCNMTSPTGPGMDTPMPQYFSVPMTQHAPQNFNGTTGVGSMMPPMAGMNCMPQVDGSPSMGQMQYSVAPTAFAPGVPQQSPFPMPLSSPVDMQAGCTPVHSQQAFFEMMPDGGQAVNAPMTGIGSQNPFCL